MVAQDPVEYVQNLLDQRDKYDRIVTQSFNDDKTFRNALNQVGVALITRVMVDTLSISFSRRPSP